MRKKAFILVVGIIIAAGALFTAVYDVIYRYNSSNTTNLNAATAGVEWGSTWGDYNYFQVYGNTKNGSENANVNFDNGTYMIIFCGQQGGSSCGVGATCIAFYKGNSMQVTIGEGGGLGIFNNKPSGPEKIGGGKTIVTTNFALPGEYRGAFDAMASGGGAGDYANRENQTLVGLNGGDVSLLYKLSDGTFAGWEGNTYLEYMTSMNFDNHSYWVGLPANQHETGFAGYGNDVRSPNAEPRDDGHDGGCGGGAGYFDGGAGNVDWRLGAGGSCTPWCYPLMSSDNFGRYVKNNDGSKTRGWTGNGYARFYRIDPSVIPSSKPVAYGRDAWLNTVGTDRYTPEYVVRAASTGWQYWGENGTIQEFDCGIRVGWVYSVSEDGKSWQGVGPE